MQKHNKLKACMYARLLTPGKHALKITKYAIKFAKYALIHAKHTFMHLYI